ncbi:MAG: hypothetical protein ABWK04_04210 [Hydrogenobacter sp.]|uniref:hypothetical protein n=1 Tax=Hydrogenobacter thermophilus TaxID=940 RepID=UPI0030F97019
MRYIVISLVLVVANLLYSAYALKTSKDYAKKLAQLRAQMERQLKLRAEIEKLVNYATAKNYAKADGFIPIDWGKVKILKDVQKSLPK